MSPNLAPGSRFHAIRAASRCVVSIWHLELAFVSSLQAPTQQISRPKLNQSAKPNRTELAANDLSQIDGQSRLAGHVSSRIDEKRTGRATSQLGRAEWLAARRGVTKLSGLARIIVVSSSGRRRRYDSGPIANGPTRPALAPRHSHLASACDSPQPNSAPRRSDPI